jgi:uncharacterized protein (TIGR00255 family)
MIRSMTGYGRGEHEEAGCRFSAEVKTVNHRYCDIAVRIPREISALEEKAKKLVQRYVSRGRVDLVISMVETASRQVSVKVDKALVQGYLSAFRELASLGVKDDVTVSTLARFPQILLEEREDLAVEAMWPVLEVALMKSMESLLVSREQEGKGLAQDLESRLKGITKNVAEIEEKAPGVVEDYRNRLRERAEKLLHGQEVDEERFLMEVALFADKCSISEELVRLRSHANAFANALRQEDAVGRKLDFIVQEINREVNTISSKANDFEISSRVVEIKSEVEKIREQVQNIE